MRLCVYAPMSPYAQRTLHGHIADTGTISHCLDLCMNSVSLPGSTRVRADSWLASCGLVRFCWSCAFVHDMCLVLKTAYVRAHD